MSPIGFVSDHMEIVYDLDTEAAELCRELGLNMVRAETAGTHPAFVEMIRELILERIEPGRERRFLGKQGARSDQCDNCGNVLEPEKLINPRSKEGGSLELRETEHFYLDLSKLEPDVKDYKYYAPGVGIVGDSENTRLVEYGFKKDKK